MSFADHLARTAQREDQTVELFCTWQKQLTVALLTIWFALWMWGGFAAYGAAGLGAFLLWAIVGGGLCVLGMATSFFLLVENLSETLRFLLRYALYLAICLLIIELWDVRL